MLSTVRCCLSVCLSTVSILFVPWLALARPNSVKRGAVLFGVVLLVVLFVCLFVRCLLARIPSSCFSFVSSLNPPCSSYPIRFALRDLKEEPLLQPRLLFSSFLLPFPFPPPPSSFPFPSLPIFRLSLNHFLLVFPTPTQPLSDDGAATAPSSSNT